MRGFFEYQSVEFFQNERGAVVFAPLFYWKMIISIQQRSHFPYHPR